MPRTWPVDLGILAVALLLAWVTKKLVEDPGQRWKVWSGSVRRSVVGMAAASPSWGCARRGCLGHAVLSARDAPDAVLTVGECDGPRALANGRCDPFVSPETTTMTAANEYFYTPSECSDLLPRLSFGDLLTTRECDFSPGGEPAERVWLVGDSHAQQWQGAVFDLARQRNWDVTISYYGGCPVADVAFVGFRQAWAPQDAQRCRDWSRAVSDEIVTEHPDRVFTSMAARHDLVDDGSGRTKTAQFAEGLVDFWTAWTAAGVNVEVLADPPFNGEVRDPDCLAVHRSDTRDCAVDRAIADPADPLVEAAGAMSSNDRVDLIDLSDRFCRDDLCLASVGGGSGLLRRRPPQSSLRPPPRRRHRPRAGRMRSQWGPGNSDDRLRAPTVTTRSCLHPWIYSSSAPASSV